MVITTGTIRFLFFSSEITLLTLENRLSLLFIFFLNLGICFKWQLSTVNFSWIRFFTGLQIRATSLNQYFTESQNDLGLEGSLKAIQFQPPCFGQGCHSLHQTARGPIQTGLVDAPYLEMLTFSGQPVLAPDYSLSSNDISLQPFRLVLSRASPPLPSLNEPSFLSLSL